MYTNDDNNSNSSSSTTTTTSTSTTPHPCPPIELDVVKNNLTPSNIEKRTIPKR